MCGTCVISNAETDKGKAMENGRNEEYVNFKEKYFF